jgi:opacity protein-like surface antigen
MRNTVSVSLTSTILSLGLLQTASAADVPVKAPTRKAATTIPVYDWSGAYVGAHIGGAWSNSTLTNDNIGASWNPGGTGFIGGLQAGYNLTAGNFLYGIEGDFDGTTFNGASGPKPTPLGAIQASVTKNWIATAAARFGITSDRLLVYGKIGGGWAQSGAALNIANGSTVWAGSHTDGGWLLGMGIEYAFASNWTGKLEYDYIGISNSTVSTPLW